MIPCIHCIVCVPTVLSSAGTVQLMLDPMANLFSLYGT